MKKILLIFAAVAFALTLSAGNPVQAVPGGGPPGGGGGMDCARCWVVGGLGVPASKICMTTEYGDGGGCYVANNQCHFPYGCQSYAVPGSGMLL